MLVRLEPVFLPSHQYHINHLIWKFKRLEGVHCSLYLYWFYKLGPSLHFHMLILLLKLVADYLQLSPCDLLNSRDKFRQEPPPELPQTKFGEIEGCFGVLITLYHVRKLLSSHGIKPAFEMLEDKMKQWYEHSQHLKKLFYLQKFHIPINISKYIDKKLLSPCLAGIKI